MQPDHFRQFIQSIQSMGVVHHILWDLPKDLYQKLLNDLGYNITSHACMAVILPELKAGFIFFKGREGKFMFMTTLAENGDIVTHINPKNVFQVGPEE